jgi:hypothetical protein
MLVSEVKQIALEWTLKYFESVPRAVGALFAGSINDKPDDAEWQDGSDVDIYIYQSGETTQRPPKLPYRGLILEPSHHGADQLANIEKILGDAHQAPHIALGKIICDPTGILKKIHLQAAPEYSKFVWINKRMLWASNNAIWKLTSCINAKPDGKIWTLSSFSLGIRNIAALAAIASIRNPTLRRCLVVSRDVLTSHGYGNLHEELLNILGSQSVTPSHAQAQIPPMLEIFRRAVDIAKTPFFFLFELKASAETIFHHGVQEMIDAGDHREAMLFIQFIYSFCGQAFENDGSELDKKFFEKYLKETAGYFGGQTLLDIQCRSQRALSFLPQIQQACENIAKSCSVDNSNK